MKAIDITIKDLLQNTALAKNLAPLDRELLLSLVLGKDREYVLAHPEKKLTAAQTAKFIQFAKRRLKGEPVAYICGKKEFYGLEFDVNKNTLIPRPETELLVEASLQRIMNYELGIRNIIDVGTGSGNIIISIVKNIPANIRKKLNFYASDISGKALRVAQKNALKHKVNRSVKFIKSDLLKFALKKKMKGNVIILANLPYVSSKLYKKNKKNLQFEPKEALISANNGLAHYTRLLEQIKILSDLRHALCVTCCFEISPEQRIPAKRFLLKYFRGAEVVFHKDLAGKFRILEINIETR
ncbi:MAG: peptide chain release factor N(5)-glutamine methyltransferase [Parcubacteria group bacterium]|jgi:release factor glutamine methyltransferase